MSNGDSKSLNDHRSTALAIEQLRSDPLTVDMFGIELCLLFPEEEARKNITEQTIINV